MADDRVETTCSSGSTGDLGIFEFYGHPANWPPNIPYPLKGTITNGSISGNWTGPPVIEEYDCDLSGLYGVTLSWSFVKEE